jgi:hypothetical protein
MFPDIQFNELSANTPARSKQEADDRIFLFLKTFEAIGKKGARRIRFCVEFDKIVLMGDLTLRKWCLNAHKSRYKEPNKKETLDKLLTFMNIQKPKFIDEDSEEGKQYAKLSLCIQIEEKYEKVTGGLLAAYIQGTIAIGFQSSDFWKQYVYPLMDPNNEKRGEVFCLSEEAHVEKAGIVEWIKYQNLSPIQKKYRDLGFDKNLPFSGDFPYCPKSDRIEESKNSKGGYIDAEGNIWEWDKLHKNHWNVQLNQKLKREKGIDYLNVNSNGKIFPKQ